MEAQQQEVECPEHTNHVRGYSCLGKQRRHLLLIDAFALLLPAVRVDVDQQVLGSAGWRKHDNVTRSAWLRSHTYQSACSGSESYWWRRAALWCCRPSADAEPRPGMWTWPQHTASSAADTSPHTTLRENRRRSELIILKRITHWLHNVFFPPFIHYNSAQWTMSSSGLLANQFLIPFISSHYAEMCLITAYHVLPTVLYNMSRCHLCEYAYWFPSLISLSVFCRVFLDDFCLLFLCFQLCIQYYTYTLCYTLYVKLLSWLFTFTLCFSWISWNFIHVFHCVLTCFGCVWFPACLFFTGF